jgi:two-component system LytT family response regulator
MKIHAIIIDDEQSGVRSLELMLTKFVPDIRIVATTMDAFRGVELINDYRPDLVFLDINMPALNGFDLLDRLQFTGFQLIFSTAYREYALKALKFEACDYLLKPVDLNELQMAVERVKKKLMEHKILPDVSALIRQFSEAKNLRVPLMVKSGVEYAWPSDILFIEAASNHSMVTLVSGEKKLVNQPLKDYESLLCNVWHYFMRIHNSYIINLNGVSRYLKEDRGNVVMHDKSVIPVSRDKKEEFFKAINLHGEG